MFGFGNRRKAADGSEGREPVDWKGCSSEVIWGDLQYAVDLLRQKSYGRFDPKTMPFTIAISPDQYKYLEKKDLMGNEVRHYFHVNWKNCFVASGSPFDEKRFTVYVTIDTYSFKVEGKRVS